MYSMAVVAVLGGRDGVWWGVLGNREGKHGREGVLTESLKLARRAAHVTPPPNTAMRGRPDMCARPEPHSVPYLEARGFSASPSPSVPPVQGSPAHATHSTATQKHAESGGGDDEPTMCKTRGRWSMMMWKHRHIWMHTNEWVGAPGLRAPGVAADANTHVDQADLALPESALPIRAPQANLAIVLGVGRCDVVLARVSQ